ncbi:MULTISPECIES: carboxypeptidase regulatory-like domain-containing protein [unclassified Rhodanobacter]|uniref:TonB-dependent receptor n=1 Tax=unclassified Rhodanobacter TaxID=2621553 RepID=UPI001BDF0206|nr:MULTISPECIES: carboxypeptidase regulatory-like domain-containing protein [unclassified Rhodanobacter]MBT2143615.1 TonB-dependent receptor [Rhodanobacter sp. LX-99]MBT2147311.1 TonB-dependent receptor [Rhodanobacter sp. LX-100]
MSNTRTLRRTVLGTALGLALAAFGGPQAYAANNDGSVAGHTQAGATVVVTNPATGLTRTITADNNGNYRFPFLPVGQYTISASSSGQQVGPTRSVTVALGTTTTVDLGAEGATSLATINVTGSVLPVIDVSSTESATIVSRADLVRLPVDQNVTSVALLAPGVVKGNAGFGGISFGGSSIAENAFYVNGLNVTDFYNRNGFSEAPFAFYDQFQVKTGGYSVEFGRTTGGVVNAVARSGTNEFKGGMEITLEPGNWHSRADDHYDADGKRYLTASRDQDSLVKTNVWASGPIVKDKLFIFAMYEARGSSPRNTNNAGNSLTSNNSDTGFWGTTIDWNITDSNALQLMAFSDKNKNTGDVYSYDYDTNTIGTKTNKVFSDTGGKNWALTWTSYLTNDLSMKLMYGRNEREAFTRSQLDIDCNYVSANNAFMQIHDPGVQLGCTSSSTVYERNDTRKQARADFEWTLGDHLLRFGYDHENDTSDYNRHYAGPGAYYYNLYAASAGSTISNGGVVPAGYDAYVRARRYEISGTFTTKNAAYYIEDNWQVTPNLVLNAGVRNDSFDNQDAAGRSYIKMSRQIAPRLGFSWDMKGDGSTKVFGNLGRYYLPVANVINIKQAGGLLDERTYYAFDGWDYQTLNGVEYAIPKLGPQIGAVDDSQGDGTVGDLRSEVDKNMDPVYQDEAILGFQQLITSQWSWGASATYRRLHNAIDDMEISATSQCGENGYIGWVMANPGKKVTVWGDTNCDGTADGYLTVDTSKEGWAMYDSDGNYLGQRGWVKPKRTYAAVELQLNRAWDEKWSMNASYTMSWNRGNAEGPVNSDTNFDDTGRTENFDDPFVNLGGNGYLPNDRRHQFKLRGTYALTPHWQFGADVNAASGGPITGFGVGNPFEGNEPYHSYYICVQNCNAPAFQDRVYERSPRGKYGRLPWTFTLNTGISYIRPFNGGEFRVKLAVYNLLNQKRTTRVDQDLQTDIGDVIDDQGNDTGVGQLNPTFRQPLGFQSPRFTQLTMSINF